MGKEIRKEFIIVRGIDIVGRYSYSGLLLLSRSGEWSGLGGNGVGAREGTREGAREA